MVLTGVLSHSVAVFLFWLFASAAWHKLNRHNLAYYQQLLQDYGVKNQVLVKGLLGGIALSELVVAMVVLYPPARKAAVLVILVMLVGYMLVIGRLLYLGRTDLECGCSGPGNKLRISSILLVRNLVLAGVAILAMGAGSALEPNTGLLVIGAVLLLVQIYLCSEKLISNFQIITILRKR